MRLRPCAALGAALLVGSFVVNTSCSTFSEGTPDVGDAGNDALAASDGQAARDKKNEAGGGKVAAGTSDAPLSA
jgi:hypothetical protein